MRKQLLAHLLHLLFNRSRTKYLSRYFKERAYLCSGKSRLILRLISFFPLAVCRIAATSPPSRAISDPTPVPVPSPPDPLWTPSGAARMPTDWDSKDTAPSICRSIWSLAYGSWRTIGDSSKWFSSCCLLCGKIWSECQKTRYYIIVRYRM